jgi:hypothetical protein
MRATNNQDIHNLRLGDIVTDTQGITHTVRGKMLFPNPAHSIFGFLVLGELVSLVSFPANPTEPLRWYCREPIEVLQRLRYSELAHGALKYFSPHFVADDSLGGRLLYRILRVEGQLYPAVILYRGEEPFCFVYTGSVYPQHLNILRSDRNAVNHRINAKAAFVSDLEEMSIPIPEYQKESVSR